MTQAKKILDFYHTLAVPSALPDGVTIMNPYQNKIAADLARQFYDRYYGDSNERIPILGINPGRFGGGITGIPFTDPIKLETQCGIKNDLDKKPELSADFIYRMIAAYGGVDTFYSRFYIGAICPLGLTANGKNLNYYDTPEVERALRNFIVTSLQAQLDFPLNRERCICLGEGKNFKYLTRLNEEYGFFKSIIPLPHPRFIMQYRRKRVEEYVGQYLAAMGGGIEV